VAIGLYAFGLAFWQTDPEGSQAALEEYLQIVHAMDYYDFAPARVLALHAPSSSTPSGSSSAKSATRMPALAARR
jgi:hypothetical protein